VKGWVGAITPRDVTTYTETESDNDFNNGNAAFMRNWPYAWAVAQATKKIKGKVGVVALPHQPGYKSVGTVGGWQLAVSKYSKHPGAAMEFVRYVTQPDTSVWLSVVGSFVPTQPKTAGNPNVIKAMPFLKVLQKTEREPRPARFLGTKYNEFSTRFFQGVNQILNGSSASDVLPATQQQLQRLMP
jgi:trehalose/maltose transport system substrate-binding protein